MPLLFLICAIGAEVIATSALKLSHGLTRLTPVIVVAIGYPASLWLLSQALKKGMQVSVAYAIWSGVGTAAIALIGAAALKEPLTFAKVSGILLIIGGVTVLNLSGDGH